MNAGKLLTVGLVGAGAYWFWKRSHAVSVPSGGSQESPAPPPSPPPPPPPNPADVRPAAAPTFNTATLLAAAQARGWQDSASPDEWNWLILTDIKVPVFNLDPIFGPVGMASRDAKYTASEFLMYARGGRGHPPGYTGLSGLGAWFSLAPWPAMPPQARGVPQRDWPIEIGRRSIEVGRPVESPWPVMPPQAQGVPRRRWNWEVPRRSWNYVPRTRFLT